MARQVCDCGCKGNASKETRTTKKQELRERSQVVRKEGGGVIQPCLNFSIILEVYKNGLTEYNFGKCR